MVRWKYVLPRLAILMAGLCFLEYGIGPLARMTVLPLIGRSRQADLAVSRLQIGLLSGTARLESGTAALNTAGKQRTLEVNRAVAQLDRGALAHGQLHIPFVYLEGLEWRESRRDGAENPADDGGLQFSPARFLSEHGDSLAQLGQTLKAQLTDKVVEESETVRVGLELRQRWEMELGRQQARLQHWQAMLNEAEQLWKSAQSTTQRLRVAGQLALQARTMEQELRTAVDDVHRLQAQAQQDKQQLDEAQAHDRDRIAKIAELPKLSPREINQRLLGASLMRVVDQAVESLAWLRWTAGIALRKPRANRQGSRGVDYDFLPRNAPDLWVQQAKFEAAWHHNGKVTRIAGSIQDACDDRDRLGRSTVFEWRGDESMPMAGKWELMPAGGKVRERWRVKWSPWRLDSDQWGKDDRLKLAVNDLRGTLWFEGERLKQGQRGRAIVVLENGSAVLNARVGDASLEMPVALATPTASRIELSWQRLPDGNHIAVESRLGDRVASMVSQRASQLASARAAEISQAIARQQQEVSQWIDNQMASQFDQLNRVQQAWQRWRSESARGADALRWLR